MRVLLISGLVLGLLLSPLSHAVDAKADEARVTNEQNVSRLTLSIVAPKRRYKPTDQLKFDIVLTNSGKKPIFIFGTLDSGYSASLLIHIRNASGKEIQPFFDDQTFASPGDSAFVKLLPDHFLGTNFYSPLDVLNMTRPGRYSIYVEYQSPFSATEVKLNPFWGKEEGLLRSNTVKVEVVR